MNLEATFEKFEDEYGNFKLVADPLHARPDLCAFLLLDKLLPGNRDLISVAEHDEIFLDVDIEALSRVASEQDILTLARCGVRLDRGLSSLAMFV